MNLLHLNIEWLYFGKFRILRSCSSSGSLLGLGIHDSWATPKIHWLPSIVGVALAVELTMTRSFGWWHNWEIVHSAGGGLFLNFWLLHMLLSRRCWGIMRDWFEWPFEGSCISCLTLLLVLWDLEKEHFDASFLVVAERDDPLLDFYSQRLLDFVVLVLLTLEQLFQILKLPIPLPWIVMAACSLYIFDEVFELGGGFACILLLLPLPRCCKCSG